MRLEELPQPALGDGADEPAGLLAVAEHDEQRDAQDAVRLRDRGGKRGSARDDPEVHPAVRSPSA